MTKISIAALTAVTFFLTSCGDEKKTETTTAACTSTETYATTGKTFIDGNCISCHGTATASNKQVALDTLANVTLNKTKSAAAITAGTMPSGKTLTADQKTKWSTWFTCGSDLK